MSFKNENIVWNAIYIKMNRPLLIFKTVYKWMAFWSMELSGLMLLFSHTLKYNKLNILLVYLSDPFKYYANMQRLYGQVMRRYSEKQIDVFSQEDSLRASYLCTFFSCSTGKTLLTRRARRARMSSFTYRTSLASWSLNWISKTLLDYSFTLGQDNTNPKEVVLPFAEIYHSYLLPCCPTKQKAAYLGGVGEE